MFKHDDSWKLITGESGHLLLLLLLVLLLLPLVASWHGAQSIE